MTRRPPEFLVSVFGCVLVTLALLIIWTARATLLREAYVSELGAEGEPTARWFQSALLLIVLGGSAIAWASRGIRSTAPLLGRWTPAVSLWIGCAFFLLASQVTCTPGCPLPIGATFTWQDLIHTLAAVIAFAAASVAMVQASFAVGHRHIARFSLAAGVVVATIAGVGGILSLLQFGTQVGSVLEFIATTTALVWLVVFGGALARRSRVSAAAVMLRRHPVDVSRVGTVARHADTRARNAAKRSLLPSWASDD
ncbi:MAG TPA: DUF998 domain-containing protein [Marisediminicola sp.]|nr:DUF998 domain-containing protein [Marisediminicola sp.]